MLRFLIATGATLMLVGFGAAGWQYWKGLPADIAATDVVVTQTAPVSTTATPPAALPESWPISPTGGAVPLADVQSYLLQDRSEPARSAVITLTTSISDLLAEGEALPDPAYFEAFADIRAPLLAEDLCPVLANGIARLCVIHSARVQPGSVDAARGTARFRIELFYGLGPNLGSDAGTLPDLATHVLDQGTVDLPVAVPDAPPVDLSTAEAALAALIDVATKACPTEEEGQDCRVLRLSLDWAPGQIATGKAVIAWLRPLPDSLRAAPKLGPKIEG